ncbi:MAG: ArsA family ATPase [Gemmatimonadota bacterium]
MLLARDILFFGGKGGVGKTTLAAAWAARCAREGTRTLLVSTDPAHSTSDILETRLGPDVRRVVAGLWAMEIDPEVETDRFIEGVKERIADSTAPRLLAEVERQIDIARLSPGAEEAALFERFTRLIEQEGESFDRIVFDTAPTGQTLRLLSLPEHMGAWIGGLIQQRRKVTALGRMWRRVAGASAAPERPTTDRVLRALEERRDLFRRARQTLTNGERTGFVFVTVAERLPVLETEKAVGTLARHGIPIAGVVVNRILPEEASGDFTSRRRELERRALERIERTFGGIPLLRVPMADRDLVGLDSLVRLADHLRPTGPGGEP